MGDSAGAAPSSRFGRICVFCGSNAGNRAVFGDAALELGNELVTMGIDLVYGGGSVGLMGLIARTVLDGGCRVLGVIPRALMPLEISGASVGDVKVVSDMHERKAEMARQSDAFIALPGGYGTMEELLEMITWSQLGIHDKPIIVSAPTADELLTKMEQYTRPHREVAPRTSWEMSELGYGKAPEGS